MKFEWDDKKNKINLKKHGISFEEAVYVFSDKEAISIYDEKHSEHEDRWITIGRILNLNIIIVIHTDGIKGESETIRIISARKAIKSEREQYIRRIGEK